MGQESRFKMRSSLIVWGATVALLLGSAVSGEAAKYTFEKIADTTTDYGTFSFSDVNYASINDEGTVAFLAVRSAGATAIYTSDGTTPTPTRADTDGAFASVVAGFPSINNQGVVAFKATRVGCCDVYIERTDGITIAGPVSGFQLPGMPSINDEGTVAFYGVRLNWVTSIFTGDGGDLTALTPPTFRFFTPPKPVINDGNTVAFVANDNLGFGLFTVEGTTFTTIARVSDPRFSWLDSPVINNMNTPAVAFLANFGSGVYMDNGAGPTLVSDNSSGPFGGFHAVSLNDKGGVAFLATYNGALGIYTGLDPIKDKVIAEGDPLLGSTVERLTGTSLGREGLNYDGQLAFVAQFLDDNGKTVYAVYRATPIPDASDIEVVVDVKPGGNPNMINLKSNGKVAVAILSIDGFDATTVNPKTLTLAGAEVVKKKNGSIMASFEDVNADGSLDLVFHVATQDLNGKLTKDDTEAFVEGKTLDGQDIKGSDSVVVR